MYVRVTQRPTGVSLYFLRGRRCEEREKERISAMNVNRKLGLYFVYCGLIKLKRLQILIEMSSESSRGVLFSIPVFGFNLFSRKRFY